MSIPHTLISFACFLKKRDLRLGQGCKTLEFRKTRKNRVKSDCRLKS